ncbi:RIP metalloprotease RseP [Segetibacter sp.]|jgi:regulator of sigma E protease|uniref:RIP metalloprotease RseP n=1 Tax=Segetibacter sp. TaxID=2231182 RepID=UPI0026226795|nr:RIP metalloprotease RseP [Segetibacter sp.]MCW3079902.1 rane-associated zinc metalloprotease [Segetibacter sp.]
MTLLAIDWSSVAVKTGQFILSFSILVVLHEMGHFFPAKWFKCRVEKFYLFFNPGISLWKKKIGETEYGLGWVPFGGYVKISGMVDESMDKEQLKKPAEPWEFRSKPAWQRLIIMIGGVVVNIVLAIALFIMIMYVWGEEYLPAKNLTYGIHADTLGTKIGLQDGDKIVSIGGKPVDNIETVEAEIILSEAKQLQVARNGQLVAIEIPDGLVKQLNKNKLQGFIDVRFPVIFDSVAKTATFTQGRVERGDKLLAFNNKPIQFFHEFDQEKSKLKNVEAPMKVLRGTDTVDVKVRVNEKSALGIYFKTPGSLFGTTVKTYTLAQSFPVGFNKCFETLDRYVTGLKQLFTGKVNASDSLGSVISIGNTFPSLWDWQKFWTLTAIFSIILAFMNILPIPALDGGHALFTLVEMVSGRKPSDKFMEYAQMVGMVLLLGLMAYALGLDFWRLFK